MGSEFRRHEIGMVVTLALVVGIMTLEQTTIFFLTPFIQPELRLSNTQAGLLVTGYWATYALSSYVVSAFADSTAGRKLILVTITLLMSLCSVLSGFASSFTTLLAARALMGLLEGPVMPIAQSIVALESSARHRGVNLGIVGNLGGNSFGAISPLLFVKIAVLYNWRAGFFATALPALICAIAIALFVRQRAPRELAGHDAAGAGAPVAAQGRNRLGEILSFRNVQLCIAICCFFLVYASVSPQFLPLYYINVRHFTAAQMSLLMGAMGVSAVLFSALLPPLSERLGRRPVLIVASLLSVACPLASIYYTGPMIVLALLVFIGTAYQGNLSLFSATIPSETVPARSLSAAMGLILALGVLTGGLAGPAIAGWSADRWGLKAALLLLAGCGAVIALISAALHETAPRKMNSSPDGFPLVPAANSTPLPNGESP
jgi:MFS family permease